MPNLLPAVLIGGPAHAGKSVLFYSLTQALRERGVRHHAIRACPDGEGNWSQECDPEVVSEIRLRGPWSNEFVRRICQDLEHRCLPFLVDMGGQPKASQISLFQRCTHAVLLLREDKPEASVDWQGYVDANGLIPLAKIFSRQWGESLVTTRTPTLEGVLTHLERGNQVRVKGPLFDFLVERIATLFASYEVHDLERAAFEQAPGEVLNLYDALHAFDPKTSIWQPEMLMPFLAGMQPGPQALYGAGPNWLYASIAAHTNRQALYLYDPRHPFGWMQPAQVQFGTEPHPELQIATQERDDATVLSITIPSTHLEYFQPGPITFPPLPLHKGLIINGRLPYWLLTALVRLYKDAGMYWIAPYHVPLQSGVIAYSRDPDQHPGDRISYKTV
ncbi:CRISPR-associated protein Csx3 [Ktedonospora formicarum]|uniref:Uncharacterized protein n=1 Tax=Ktedonospora formicarum TaxID=2778364 RepID=A0A8J3MYH1_9CHLR|nr:CRISPR-associated protein Csx3 [Ktedonospora formicarum]GHO49655.1 hypothetical protein KSX_78180 [Ktedonospora formicarum]